MGYTRGIVVEYQYHGAGIGIVLLVVKNHLYPIPDQYQNAACTAAISSKENQKIIISMNTRIVKQEIGARTTSA